MKFEGVEVAPSSVSGVLASQVEGEVGVESAKWGCPSFLLGFWWPPQAPIQHLFLPS